MIKNDRVSVYIDGFNLYFGMLQKGFRHLLWLDLVCLSKSFLRPGQILSAVNYFTSYVRNNPEKEKRQNTFIEALQARGGINMQFGYFQMKNFTCRSCGHTYPDPAEKMTDVNISVSLISDAYEDKFDTAILMSGDSDLVPPVKIIRNRFPKKKIVIAFPPARLNNSLQYEANASFVIGRKTLKDCQLPDVVKKPNGFELRCPSKWQKEVCAGCGTEIKPMDLKV